MTETDTYRLLYGLAKPLPPLRVRAVPRSPTVVFARNVVVTYAIALVVVLVWQHQWLQFLVRPLLDTLKSTLIQTSIHFQHPSAVTVVLAALLLAAPVIAVQIWTLVARRVSGREVLGVAWWRAILPIGGFAAGAALSHYMLFPAIWPLLPQFDISAIPRLGPLRYLDEFAGLHIAIMLLGGLGVQVPLLTLLKRRKVRA